MLRRMGLTGAPCGGGERGQKRELGKSRFNLPASACSGQEEVRAMSRQTEEPGLQNTSCPVTHQ